MCSISWKRFRNTWMIRIVLFWKIYCPGQKNFRQGSAKLKYRWLQSSRLKMSRYSLFCVYAKVVHSARYITFKLCSSCPYKNELYETLSNIGKLNVQLEQQLLTNLDSLIIAQNLSQGFYTLFGDWLSDVQATWVNFGIHGTVISSDTVP